jgi:hypothetical protein
MGMGRLLSPLAATVSRSAPDLDTVADTVARACLRHARSQAPDVDALPADIAEAERRERDRIRLHVAAIRVAIRRRDFAEALQFLTGAFFSVGLMQFLLLEHAFPLMTADERAGFLQDVWCRSKSRLPLARALRLFHAAPSLRATVPSTWAAEVRIYRGAWRHQSWPNAWQGARRRVHHGLSWTTDHATAVRFAQPGLDTRDIVGCVGTATVARSAILAYFMDPEEVTIDGKTYPVEGYREHECIVEPTTVQRLTCERVE